MHQRSTVSPRRWRRAVTVFLLLSALVSGLVGVPVGSVEAALPPGAEPFGAATLTPSSGTAAFRLDLPVAAACQGDSATGGYRWSTFLAPSNVDVSQLVYVAGTPTVAGGAQIDLLYDSLGTGYVNRTTALNSGQILGLPGSFLLSIYPANYLSEGDYDIGVACTLNGTVERYWSTTIALTLDAAGLVDGFGPATPPATAPSSPTVNSPLTLGVSGRISGTLAGVTATPSVTSYTVTATPASGSSVSVTVTPPATTFTIDGLVNRVAYTVTATATNAVGTSPSSVGVLARPYVANPAPTMLAAGAAHSCAVLTGGTVRCWGSNANGQLGNGSLASSTAPVVATGMTGASQVSAGDQFSCAVSAAGPSGRVRCWGLNGNGQLGNGGLVRSTTPKLVMATAATPLSGVSRVATGAAFACAVSNPGVNGTVRCWGANAAGQLGDGTVTQRVRPVQVKATATTMLKGVTAVAAGGSTACALLTTGSVKCWGLNSSGQLGNNSLVGSRLPVQVTGINGVATKASSIAVGANFACARLATGAVRCWGNNASGQLGNNSIVTSKVPVVVKTSATVALSGVTAIAAGAGHACAVRGSGAGARVSCWGNNLNGQLGIGTLANARVATSVTTSLLNGVKGLVLGGAHSLAVVPSAVRSPTDATGWGRNANGQLGVGGTTRTTPLVVASL